MKKSLNLRQIEAFKAVIEHGSVNRAADALFVSQPAVSKLLLKLEQDSGLALFERVKGRLAPTQHGMRLYEEVDRIFVGLRQLEEAIDSIRRDEQRQLHIGVMPALSGSFVRRVTMEFIKKHPDVHITIETRGSQFLAEWLVSRQIDVVLAGSLIDNPYIDREPLTSSPLVCALPLDHPLTRKRVIRATDLDNEPFVTFAPNSQTDKLTRQAFLSTGARLRTVLETVTAPTVCEFVAAGLGVSLIHPLFAEGARGRLALRRFDPEIEFTFQLCWIDATRNASLVEAFMQDARRVSQQISDELLHGI